MMHVNAQGMLLDDESAHGPLDQDHCQKPAIRQKITVMAYQMSVEYLVR